MKKEAVRSADENQRLFLVVNEILQVADVSNLILSYLTNFWIRFREVNTLGLPITNRRKCRPLCMLTLDQNTLLIVGYRENLHVSLRPCVLEKRQDRVCDIDLGQDLIVSVWHQESSAYTSKYVDPPFLLISSCGIYIEPLADVHQRTYMNPTRISKCDVLNFSTFISHWASRSHVHGKHRRRNVFNFSRGQR